MQVVCSDDENAPRASASSCCSFSATTLLLGPQHDVCSISSWMSSVASATRRCADNSNIVMSMNNRKQLSNDNNNKSSQNISASASLLPSPYRCASLSTTTIPSPVNKSNNKNNHHHRHRDSSSQLHALLQAEKNRSAALTAKEQQLQREIKKLRRAVERLALERKDLSVQQQCVVVASSVTSLTGAAAVTLSSSSACKASRIKSKSASDDVFLTVFASPQDLAAIANSARFAEKVVASTKDASTSTFELERAHGFEWMKQTRKKTTIDRGTVIALSIQRLAQAQAKQKKRTSWFTMLFSFKL